MVFKRIRRGDRAPIALLPTYERLRRDDGDRSARSRRAARGLKLPPARLREPNDHGDPVLGLIVQRALDGSRPGARCDGARIALAIEGGAMSGVVSGGMCAALEALGLIDSFDGVYGASAGAINA